MNWNKASSIAEILSSVAILITLVYLVVEIQQNAEATQANTRQAILDSDQQFLKLFIDSPSHLQNRWTPIDHYPSAAQSGSGYPP